MTKTFQNATKVIRPEDPSTKFVIPTPYDMGVEDLGSLLQMAVSGDPAAAIILAFNFGFVMGNRATISRNLKRL